MAEKGSDGRIKRAGQWDQVEANMVTEVLKTGTEAQTTAHTEPATDEPGEYSSDAASDETLP